MRVSSRIMKPVIGHHAALETLRSAIESGRIHHAWIFSGPPGIGKTSAATLVARQMGYDIMELNASDTRSKKLLTSNLADVTQNTVLRLGASAPTSRPGGRAQPKRIIIMDEVDGMSSGDRGGMQALIASIKKSKVPIICICNDAQKSSVRHCKCI